MQDFGVVKCYWFEKARASEILTCGMQELYKRGCEMWTCALT